MTPNTHRPLLTNAGTEYRGDVAYKIEDGQVPLHRFNTKERRAIAKARRRVKKLWAVHSGMSTVRGTSRVRVTAIVMHR